MLRNGDWGNFTLHCDEAQALKAQVAWAVDVLGAQKQRGDRSPFGRSEQERLDPVLGLARFKVAQGDVEGARVITRQVGLTWVEVTLPDSGGAAAPPLSSLFLALTDAGTSWRKPETITMERHIRSTG